MTFFSSRSRTKKIKGFEEQYFLHDSSKPLIVVIYFSERFMTDHILSIHFLHHHHSSILQRNLLVQIS